MDEIQERSPLQLHFIASSPDAVFESSNLSYDFRSYVKAEEYKNVYIRQSVTAKFAVGKVLPCLAVKPCEVQLWGRSLIN